MIKISGFYISDLHFGHQKCIDFDKRPFKSLNDMNETMIQNWNSVVSKGDLIVIFPMIKKQWKNSKITLIKRITKSQFYCKVENYIKILESFQKFQEQFWR